MAGNIRVLDVIMKMTLTCCGRRRALAVSAADEHRCCCACRRQSYTVHAMTVRVITVCSLANVASPAEECPPARVAEARYASAPVDMKPCHSTTLVVCTGGADAVPAAGRDGAGDAAGHRGVHEQEHGRRYRVRNLQHVVMYWLAHPSPETTAWITLLNAAAR